MPRLADSSRGTRVGKSSSVMTTWDPLCKRGVNHANDHILNMLAVSVGFSMFGSGESSGEMHSSAKESNPRKRTAHFKGTSGVVGNVCA